jgi:hypothetical protein
MARNSQRHQRKLAKQKAKRQSRKREIAKRQSVGVEGQLARASAAPVLDALVPADIFEAGLGQVLISRELPHQQVAYAVFLVDVWCLGVKDAFGNIVSKSEYKENLLGPLQNQFDMQRESPEYVRKLVEGAVEYAAQFRLQPHPDYRPARAIFGDIDAAACTEPIEFGKGGQPFYASGPYETASQSLSIIRRLQDAVGEGNFHCFMPVAGAPALGWLPEADDLPDDESNDADKP